MRAGEVVTEASQAVKRGRRPWVCGDDPARLAVKMSGALYDRIYLAAKEHHGGNVAAAARDLIERGLTLSDIPPTISDTPK